MFGIPLKNLGLFAAVSIVATALLAVITFVLANQFGFGGGSAGAWIGPFAAGCVIAGNRYAKSRDWAWTRDERHRLALAYAVTSMIISVALASLVLLVDPDMVAILTTSWGGMFVVVGFAAGSLISYGLARWLLGNTVRPRAT